MQIEELTPEEFSHFLSYGELENKNDTHYYSLLSQFLSDEASHGIDERGRPQSFEDVCSSQGHDCF